MRVIFAGTGGFGCLALERMIASPHDVVCVVTKPDRRQGRGRRPAPSPVKQVATQGGAPLYQPDDVNADPAIEHLRACRPDVLVVVDFGQILLPAALDVPTQRAINLHASLLPKLRGAAPINWAILRGHRETGVTIIEMCAKVDAGRILDQWPVPIEPDETSVELEAKLARVAADRIVPVLDGIASGSIQGQPQDATGVTRARRLRREDRRLDWTRSADWICRRVRGLQPWPNAHAIFHRQDSPTPTHLILKSAHPVNVPPSDEPSDPGTIVAAGEHGILAAAGEGGVMITRLQPQSGREMSAAEFLRGHPVAPGDRLASEDM